MSRILKRPMFRSGGSTNEGIMHGLVDRKGYADGTEAEKYRDEYMKMLAEVQPAKPRFNMGEMGLNLISGEYAGDGLLQNIAGSARGPYTAFTKADDARGGLDYQKRMTATTMGIKRAEDEAAIRAKALSKDTRTTLMKNLEAAGFVRGTPEYEEALKLRTLGEGQAGFSSFGKQANIDNAIIAGNYGLEGIDLLTTIASIGAESPTTFGIAGKIKGFGKNLATEVEGAYSGSVQKAANLGGIDSEAYEFLGDQNFAGIQPLENALAIHIARNRNKSGRLLKAMIEDAKEDAKLQGLGGSELVKQRLPFIFKEFLDTTINQYEAAGKTETEIAAIINPKIKEFNAAMARLSGIDVTSTENKTSVDGGLKKGEDGVWRFE